MIFAVAKGRHLPFRPFSPQEVWGNVIFFFDDLGEQSWALLKDQIINVLADDVAYFHNLFWGTGDRGRREAIYWDRDHLVFKNNVFVNLFQQDADTDPPASETNVFLHPPFGPFMNVTEAANVAGASGTISAFSTDAASATILKLREFATNRFFNFGIQTGSLAENAGTCIPGFHPGCVPSAPYLVDAGPFPVGFDPGRAGIDWPRPMATAWDCSPSPVVPAGAVGRAACSPTP